VTVNQVAEADLPPLDADFATHAGRRERRRRTIRREVRQNVEAEVAKRIKMSVKDQVMDALYTRAPRSTVPRSLLDERDRSACKQAASRTSSNAA
jgi:trigger factor